MATRIAAEVREMLRIRSEIGNSGIDLPASALHQPGQARMPRRFARSFEYEPQPFLDQVPELAAAQCRFRLGPTVKIIWYFDGGFHRVSP
jgi:hypothetical protein